MDTIETNSPENVNTAGSAQTAEMVDVFCRAMAKAMTEEQNARQHRNEPAQEIQSINLPALFFRILENLKYVVVAALLLALLGGVYGKIMVRPMYAATAKLYIVGQTESSINLSSLQIGTVLSLDYQEVFKTWEVHEMVRQKLGLNYTYSQMQSLVNVTKPDDTRVLYITVNHADPQLAADMANAYAEAAQRFILETMDGDAPNIFSVALVPGVSVSTGGSSYIIIGFLLGTILSIGCITLMFVFDDRPRNPANVEDLTGLPTLAVLPVMDMPKGKKQLKSRRKETV